ncbi:MAG: hypothetical protein EPO08_19050 [Rhodospirillaceae bacterium]|nr:MAG: hypothetical protein EPO08_19050 [Rhodospirillaceae bacterium]
MGRTNVEHARGIGVHRLKQGLFIAQGTVWDEADVFEGGYGWNSRLSGLETCIFGTTTGSLF